MVVFEPIFAHLHDAIHFFVPFLSAVVVRLLFLVAVFRFPFFFGLSERLVLGFIVLVLHMYTHGQNIGAPNQF